MLASNEKISDYNKGLKAMTWLKKFGSDSDNKFNWQTEMERNVHTEGNEEQGAL